MMKKGDTIDDFQTSTLSGSTGDTLPLTHQQNQNQCDWFYDYMKIPGEVYIEDIQIEKNQQAQEQDLSQRKNIHSNNNQNTQQNLEQQPNCFSIKEQINSQNTNNLKYPNFIDDDNNKLKQENNQKNYRSPINLPNNKIYGFHNTQQNINQQRNLNSQNSTILAKNLNEVTNMQKKKKPKLPYYFYKQPKVKYNYENLKQQVIQSIIYKNQTHSFHNKEQLKDDIKKISKNYLKHIIVQLSKSPINQTYSEDNLAKVSFKKLIVLLQKKIFKEYFLDYISSNYLQKHLESYRENDKDANNLPQSTKRKFKLIKKIAGDQKLGTLTLLDRLDLFYEGSLKEKYNETKDSIEDCILKYY